MSPPLADPQAPSAAWSRRTVQTIAVLAITQIIGWGTTYYIPSILVRPLVRDLDLSPEMVFAGVTIMLVVSALVGPRVGRLIDRFGARLALTAGSVVAAAALVCLAAAEGLVGYVLAWSLIGLAMPLMLMTAAFAQIAQISGPGARRAISALTLFTGFTSTVFWPLTAWLEAEIGWRSTVLLFAGLHVCVCLPLHVLLLPRRETSPQVSDAGPGRLARPLSPARHKAAFVLIAIAFSAIGFISWGLALLLPELFKLTGLPAAAALTIAALSGPFQVTARFADMVLAARFSAVATATVAVSAMAPALTVMLLAGGEPAAAVVFILLWGFCNGLITVTRAAVPLELFGPDRYATFVGRLSLPQNLSFSASPIVFTALLERAGPTTTLLVALAFALISAVAMILLGRLVRSDHPPSEKVPP